MGFWVSQGFGRFLVYPLRLFTLRIFILISRLGFHFNVSQFGLSFLFKPGLEGWVFGSLRGSVGYGFTHWDYFTFKTFTLKLPFGLLFLWKLGILVRLGIDLIVWLFFIVS